MPEVGTQVLAGGLKSGEGLDEVVLREVAAETGLLTATVVREIAVEDKPYPDRGQPRRTSFFFLQAPAETPIRGTTRTSSAGTSRRLTLLHST
ncbi:NUDIX domain-containing protein [Streptomyces sp. NPDC086835]|uniref:NUDIX domain-containing protein n=1 Tax=Streptomyces sp. NPDC086835 TaxID=3365761 RepID=UPI00381ADADD